MALQQPALDLAAGGTARRGLVVRHLILPGAVDDTLVLLKWIRENLSPYIGLSLMSQYHPCFRAPEEIRRGVSAGRIPAGGRTRPWPWDSITCSCSRSRSGRTSTSSRISGKKSPSAGNEGPASFTGDRRVRLCLRQAGRGDPQGGRQAP